jgi:hypothetical protein
MLRWLFTKGHRVLTCEVRIDQRGTFEVSVLPWWNVSQAIVEGYSGATDAMRRHAEIAAAFGQAGWTVARQTPTRSTEVAA